MLKVIIIVGTLVLILMALAYVMKDDEDEAKRNPEMSHPYLFFHCINESPGFANHAYKPWKTYESNIVRTADTAMTKDFTGATWPGDPRDDIMYRAYYAVSLALAWQITGDDRYASKAEEALLNLDRSSLDNVHRNSLAIRDYCIAYDMLQPYMSAATDNATRNKLATLADRVYDELNDGGTNRDYVTFWDHHGQAYINVAFAGLALRDFTNPDHIGIDSGPVDWLKCGTDYFFTYDPLHTDHRPIVAYGLDPATGKDLIGYNSYTLEGMVLFAQAYTRCTGENFLDKYPVIKGHFTAEVWDTYPNDIQATYETLHQFGFDYHTCIANLLDESNRSAVLRHEANLRANLPLMPAPSTEGPMSDATQYLCEHNYTGFPRNPPPYTSHLDACAMFQTMRTGWNNDSDFLSMVTTQNISIHVSRLQMRCDQLGIQYYGKGDVLMADGGENKYVLDTDYGMSAVYHNVVGIEDPRLPFDVERMSGGRYRGPLKEDPVSYATVPAIVSRSVVSPGLSILTATQHVEYVGEVNWNDPLRLSSPVDLERTILLPESDYFVVVDRASSREPWTFRNIWRPTSFNIVTTDSPDSPGHVLGGLTIGGSDYDWQSVAYEKEVDIGITANSFTWGTTNPYGKAVEFKLFSVPASEIYVTKSVSSLGGRGLATVVYSPVVYFRTTSPGKNMYRITALLSRYTSDADTMTYPVDVTGAGNAMSIDYAGHNDIVYTGSGTSKIGPFSTDASTMFARTDGGRPTVYALLNGTYLSRDGQSLIKSTGRASYIAVKQGDKITIDVKCDKSITLTLSRLALPGRCRLTSDGEQYNNWISIDDNTIRIIVSKGEHSFEISPGG